MGRLMPRFAANLAFLFTERPLLERFAAAAAAGFKAVELQFPYDHPPSAIKAEIDRNGLTMLGVNTRAGEEAGLAAVPGRERDFAARFTEALDYVVAIGGRSIHCMAGTVLPEQRPAAERIFIANLTRAADIAAVDRPNVRMQFDFYHAQIVGGDLITRFTKLLPFVGHVQVAAVPSRAEPDEGEVNYPAIFSALDRLGYSGWVGCEYKPRGRTEDGLAWGRAFGLHSG